MRKPGPGWPASTNIVITPWWLPLLRAYNKYFGVGEGFRKNLNYSILIFKMVKMMN